MIKTIIGLILLLVPFLLIIKFEDKKKGFFYILSFLIAFHLFVAVLTQAFHIFNYGVVIGINAFTALVVLVKTDFKELAESLKKIKIDWILIFVIIILFIQLSSVHYDYTGKVTTVIEPYREVENMNYPYPYFSDEWSAISLIQYSTASGSLPLVNPLWYNIPFPNFELPFHSFVSEIILLLDLNPLTQYTILTIFSGLLICLLIYFILRFNKINKFVSATACLSVLYVVNGANLPGLWTLIPLIMGIISMLLGLLFMSVNKTKMILFLAFLTLIFYPPLFVFYSVSYLFYFLFSDISNQKKIRYFVAFLGICLITAVVLSFFAFFSKDSFGSFSSYIFGRLFYETFTKGHIPDFSIWKVIPVLSLFLAGTGFFAFIKRKEIKNKSYLIAPVVIGLIYWWAYTFILWRVIIEYERVVFATSVLIVLLSGFGLHYLIIYFKKINFVRKYKLLQILIVLIFALFLMSAFIYTERDAWFDLKLYSVVDDRVLNPASPANNYLHPDDLKLFEGIEEKRFLSIPWKGVVIGTATNNYPMETKPATLTNNHASFFEFITADCEKKIEIAKRLEIDYIYSQEFDCERFELKGVSEEGLYLYEFIKG